jgi:GNAT superfamily N-acetyltransferase
VNIERVNEADLDELLGLMRGYCDFYEVDPSDEALLALSRALLADPENEGIQLIARDGAGRAIGFATVYWTWQTLSASRLAVMNDLFVAPAARGRGLGAALIEECLRFAGERGAGKLAWQTAPANEFAQRLYDRVGAVREHWIDYHLRVDSS